MEMKEVQTEVPVYSVCMKKGYWIFTLICSILVLVMSVLTAVLSILTCKTVGQSVVCGMIVLFFAGMGTEGILALRVRAEVFSDGRIQYYGLFQTRQYHISQIAACKTQDESFRVRYGEGVSISHWDVMTTFTDADGKKLFRFGLAYQNVDRLQKNVKSSQKAAARCAEKEKRRKKSRKNGPRA